MKKTVDKDNARLSDIMKANGMTRAEVADILDVTKGCVDQYLRPRGTPNYRKIPSRLLRLLEFEIGERAPTQTKYHRGLAKV